MEFFFLEIMPLYIGIPTAIIGLMIALGGGIKMYTSRDDMTRRSSGWKMFLDGVIIGIIGAICFLTGPILHGIFYGLTPPN